MMKHVLHRANWSVMSLNLVRQFMGDYHVLVCFKAFLELFSLSKLDVYAGIDDSISPVLQL